MQRAQELIQFTSRQQFVIPSLRPASGGCSWSINPIAIFCSGSCGLQGGERRVPGGGEFTEHAKSNSPSGMAGEKEQGKKGAGGKEVAKDDKPKTINLDDHHSIKCALDDAVSEVVLGRGFVENVTLSNVKMGLGLITCSIAAAAQFYPKKFPENKTFLIGCIVLYVFFNALLQYVIFTKEKDHILFTYAFPGSFSSTGLAISSKLPRNSDMYTLTIASADPQSIAAHPPVRLTKSVTKWFTKGGVLLEDSFFSDVEKLLDDYAVDKKESRKSK